MREDPITGQPIQQLSKWKKKLMEHQAKRAITKQSKDFRKRITPFMDFLVTQMETATDEEAQNLAIYICTEVISGFEEKEQKKFVYDSLGLTLENMK